MNSKKLSLYTAMLVAAAVSGIVVGCGGSSASAAGANATVTATGGVTVQSGTSLVAVQPSQNPQTIPVTLSDGTTETATLPPGEQVAPNTPFDVIPPNQPFISGLTAGPSQKKPQQPNNPVFVDGAYSGVNLNADGSLQEPLILDAGNHTVTVNGAFNITSGSNTLTVQQFIFGVVVDTDGLASIPSSLNMRIPANGGSTSNGNFVTIHYPTPDFASGTGTLTLAWAGVTKTQTTRVDNGAATFKDPLSDSSDTVPATGVNSVTFNYIGQTPQAHH